MQIVLLSEDVTVGLFHRDWVRRLILDKGSPVMHGQQLLSGGHRRQFTISIDGALRYGKETEDITYLSRLFCALLVEWLIM